MPGKHRAGKVLGGWSPSIFSRPIIGWKGGRHRKQRGGSRNRRNDISLGMRVL